MERGPILNIACLSVVVYESPQEETMNVEPVEGEYVPGSDGYLR
jgi:hypothetical protein